MNRLADRTEAGRLLAQKMGKYKGKDVVVYALPKGGVVTAVEIAHFLHAPLDLIITRKISRPDQPEYAIAAVAENGHLVGTRKELALADKVWLKEKIMEQRQESSRRRMKYMHGHEIISSKGKFSILVDDGVATGLTLRVGIIELKHHNPQKIIVAVPIVTQPIAKIIEAEADELIALEVPSDDTFLGAVSAYYASFPQVNDQEVVKILDTHEAWLQREKKRHWPQTA